MHKTLLSAALCATMATGAFAGGYAEPMMETEPEMIAADTASSSVGILVPVIALILFALAASNSGGGGGGGGEILPPTGLD